MSENVKSRFDRVGISELTSVKDRFSFAGKKAMVTGAGGGIGYAVASNLAELGADVALVDLREKEIQEYAEYIAERYRVKTLALRADLTKPEEVRETVKRVTESFGGLDAVHSNAGSHMSSIDNGDMPYDKWRQLQDTNYNSMFLVNQAVCNWMRDNHHPGAVVNTASLSGHIVNRGKRHSVCYSSTKAAVLHLTKAFAMDYVTYGIRVNSISPGVFASGLHDNIPKRDKILAEIEPDIPMQRLGNLNEIGGAVAFLLSDLASYITGTDLEIDGGYLDW